MFEDDDKEEFFFRFQIVNFSFAAQKLGEGFESLHFVADILEETEWYLTVYPRGKEDEEFIAIFLTRCSDDANDSEIPLIFTIELEAADSSRREQRVSPQMIFEHNTTWGFNQYIRRETLLEDMKSTYLPDDTLTIHCKIERIPPEFNFITEYFAETTPETVETKVDWNIKKWREIKDFSDVYKDVVFTGDDEALFRMFLCESKDSEKNLILKLKRINAKKVTNVICHISVLNNEGSEVLVQTTCHCFNDTLELTSEQFFEGENIQDSFLQDGTLSLRCVLKMNTGKTKTRMSKKVREAPKDEVGELDAYIKKELTSDYERMFLSGNFIDVKVRAGRKVVDCHKGMLYARSPVLSDLLDKAEESAEGDECNIYLDDLDGDTLEKMIYFLYTDKINNINPTSALKLFVAGHKYQISYLKAQCSMYLSKVFTFENIYDIVIAAHLCENGDLKRRAINYLAEYFSRICLTTEWANFRKSEKELAAYVCREIRRIKHL